MAAGEHLAHPGEILIDDATLVALGDGALVSEQRLDPHSGACFTLLHTLSPFPEPHPWEPVTLSADALRPWVPHAIWERETADLGAFLTELRQVVALFLHFGGIDFDTDDDAGTRLDVLIRRVQVVLAELGGTLLQLTVGDKGAYLYAAFGAPMAHEDDARRAARAALNLHAIAADLGLPPFQIGLSQGVVRTGAYGGPTRQTYGALGDEVNVAARLMQHAAPGTTLATERVRSLTSDSVLWESLSPLLLKGKVATIPVSRLQARHRDTTALQRLANGGRTLIGRRVEIAQLEAALEAHVAKQAGRTIVLEGEAGIGKSQLALATLAAAHRSSIRALVGAGDAIEQHTPAFAWRAIVSQLVGLDGLPDDLAVRRAQLLAHLRTAGEPETLVPLLNPILALGFDETDDTISLTGGARVENMRALLLRLLHRAAASAPLLLLLEDIHWLDPTSWDMLAGVAQELPVLLVLTTRPPGNQPHVAARQLRELKAALRIRLGPLTASELDTLLCERLGCDAIAPDVAMQIFERTAGNPYFSVELAATLQERGVVQFQAGVCDFTPGGKAAAAVFPDSIQGVIGYRIDQLAPAPQLTIKVASVFGRVFATRALCSVHPAGVKAQQLEIHLADVARLNLAVLETIEPEPTYMFCHIIAQEVAYSLLPTAMQRALHGAVARWFEVTHAKDTSLYAHLLAYHWQRAGYTVRAVGYLEQAGAQALRNGSYREAKELLEQAEALDGAMNSDPRAIGAEGHPARLHRLVRRGRMLGEACFGLGEPTVARPYLRQALERAGQSLPASSAGQLFGSAVQLARQATRWPLSDREPLAGGTRDPLLDELVALYEIHARICFINNEAIPSLYLALTSLDLAEQNGQAMVRARAYAGANALFTALRLPRVAAHYRDRADALAMLPELEAIRGYLGMVQGMTEVGQARWGQGIAHLTEGITTSERRRDWRTWGDSVVMLGLAYYYLGQFARAEELFCQLEALGAQRGTLEATAYGRNGQGMVMLRQGRMEAAALQLEQAATLYAQTNDLQMGKFMNQGLRAALFARQGRWHEAEHLANEVAQATGLLPQLLHIGIDGLLGWAEVALQLLAQEPTSRARRHSAWSACVALRRYGQIFPIGRPAAWRFTGYLLLQQGRGAAALGAWRQSLETARHLAMPYDEGLAHAELGLHLPPTEPLRQEHLVRAITLLSHIDAQADLERVIRLARVGHHQT